MKKKILEKSGNFVSPEKWEPWRFRQWMRPGPFWTTTVAWAIVAVVFVASYERRIYHLRGQLNEQPWVTGVIVHTQLLARDFCPFPTESLQIYYIADTVS